MLRRLLGVFECIATEPLPPEILEKKETEDLVRMTLASMSVNYRTVLTLYYLRGPSLVKGAIKVLLHRARVAFKEAFVRLSDVSLWEGGQL